MARPARLVATVTAPLDMASADAPSVLHSPGQRLLVQRGDTELVTIDLRTIGTVPGAEVRFAAPWPRSFGTATVSPDQRTAVFAGVHALRAVDAAGNGNWELRHRCWCGSCEEFHSAFDEYADDPDHAYAESGSVAFSSDGALTWANVPGPLTDERAADAEPDDWQELWIVLNSTNGTVLGRHETMTMSSNSLHTPSANPTQMGVSLGEGEDGSPSFWGRWSKGELTVRRIALERVLMDSSPSGRRLLATNIGQWSLFLYETEDESAIRKLDAAGTVPAQSGSRMRWDFEATFVDDATVIASTTLADPTGAGRHWLIDVDRMALVDEVSYPVPVFGSARSAGEGFWYTLAEDESKLHLWQLAAD